jgi:hypothetical protein
LIKCGKQTELHTKVKYPKAWFFWSGGGKNGCQAISITTYSPIPLFPESYIAKMGTTVAQWLRYCATNQKVAGLIPDDVIGIFH